MKHTHTDTDTHRQTCCHIKRRTLKKGLFLKYYSLFRIILFTFSDATREKCSSRLVVIVISSLIAASKFIAPVLSHSEHLALFYSFILLKDCLCSLITYLHLYYWKINYLNFVCVLQLQLMINIKLGSELLL